MNFIDFKLLPLETLDKNYSLYLVVLSVIIAIASSFTAFGTSERIYAASQQSHKILWNLFGAISMGVGIWAMHFIGSLALELPIPVSYNPRLTLLSVFPAIMASSVVLWLMNQAQFNILRLVFCGVLLGSAIGTMHYLGMAAMELNASMVYIKSIFALSILVAITLASIALKIQFDASHQGQYQTINTKQCFAALVMGLAVSSMHYTAMYAVVFLPSQNTLNSTSAIEASTLSTSIAAIVFLFLSLAIIIPHTLRFRQLVATLKKNEQDLKIAAIAFQTHEGIMVTDHNYRIIRINEAFTRISGYGESEVIGKTPKMLQSGKHNNEFYKKFWNRLIKDEKWSGEVTNRKKNGDLYNEWQTISVVKDQNHNIKHYISFFSDITEFKLTEDKITKLAFYDSLTELPNRRLLYDRLEYELGIARRYNRVGILFFLDLDRFKHINDSLGHSIGDELLIETANRLQSLIRETDTAVRLGGDEFIVLVSAQDGINSDLIEQSNMIAGKIIKAINSPFLANGHKLFISTSIGVTLYTGIDETVETILKRADTAMYQAKEAGRNTFRFYQQSMQDAADSRLGIERNLRAAIVNNELSIHYQPQLSNDNKIIGAEALLRWQNTELGSISPAEFIPIAEETGLIIPIGEWTLNEVCRQINAWSKENINLPHIAINISAKQFHQADFVSMIVHTVSEYNINPSKILLEITESVFIGNIEEVIDKMHALKKQGFRFSMDDFGTGYSSLTSLKRLPFDQLKIDQSFVRELVDQPTDAAIVKAIVAMASSMGLDLIAEGVETNLHLVFLKGFGCHNYQGYYFSKPLVAEKLAEYVIQYEKDYPGA